MSAVAEQSSSANDMILTTPNKKQTSALVKIKRAIRRMGKSGFAKTLGNVFNSLVNSTWSLGKTAGRLAWIAGCLTITVIFPLAMEIEREQTIMEIHNREQERMMRSRRS